jgi:uncharacterized hydrophobic protein (TIGR00271 family)
VAEQDKSNQHHRKGQVDNSNGEQRAWYTELGAIFRDVLDLKEGLDRYGTILSIRKNIHLKGINIWLLICAIMVASIGLDKNSPAVIIGGMLISPLMYPILGIGLSVAINDRRTMVQSMENFSVAVLVTLITSTIYFALTPYGKPNVEILSRTRPDIMDVFVGFFGGIAGIVAGSRKEGISAAIPGVAIATALLPPVCVAGYGLANLNMVIFGGAFYLFLLNTFFITIATYLVVRYLKFPYKQHTTDFHRRQARMVIGAASVIIIIPSFFFLRNSVSEIRTMRNIESFVIDHLENDRINDFGWNVKDADSVKILEVDCYVEDRLNKVQIDSLERILTEEYRVRDIVLDLNQIEARGDEIREIQANQSELLTEMERTRGAMSILVTEKDEHIGELEERIDLLERDSVIFSSLKEELRIIYPDLVNISAGNMWNTDFDKHERQFTLLLDWTKTYYPSVYEKRTDQITRFTMTRYPFLDTVYVIHQ